MTKKIYSHLVIPFFILSRCFAFGGNVFSQDLENTLGFTFSAQMDYRLENGFLNEFVYQSDSSSESYKLSELNWEIKNSNCIGGNLQAGWRWINIGFDFSLGIPGRSGNLYDSDWQNPNDHSMKTNYSISENINNKNQKIALSLFSDIPCTPSSIKKIYYASLRPYFTYSYEYYSFLGENGYGWYGDSRHSKTEQYVPYDSPNAMYFSPSELFSIGYEREQSNFYLGLAAEMHIFEQVGLNVGYGISFLTLVNSIDTHYSNSDKTSGINYFDSMKGSFASSLFSVKLEYNIWDGFCAGVDYTFNFLSDISGKNKQKSLDSEKYPGYYTPNIESKCSGQTHTLSFYVKYIFKI